MVAAPDGQAAMTLLPDGVTADGATKCLPAHGATAADGEQLATVVRTAVAVRWPEVVPEDSAEPVAVEAEVRRTEENRHNQPLLNV